MDLQGLNHFSKTCRGFKLFGNIWIDILAIFISSLYKSHPLVCLIDGAHVPCSYLQGLVGY